MYRFEGKRGPVWRALIRLPDGRRQNRKIGAAWEQKGRPPAGYHTRRTAEAWLRDRLDEARRGTLPGLVRTGETFAGTAEVYLEHVERDRQLKPSTLRDYRSILDAHLLPAFGDRRLEDITGEDVQGFQAGLPVANRTKVKILTLMHGIMERARRQHRLPANPVADLERPRARAHAGIDVFSPEEVHALVRAASSEQDAAIYLTAAFTGLRRGELVALRWRDVDFPAARVRVSASYVGGQLTAPKSGKVRSVPLAPEVAQALARLGQRPHWTGADDLVFAGAEGGHLDGSALSRRFRAALNEAGLRQLRFHDLRHTFGTRMIGVADIVRVQEWMGHADVQTTRKYLHYVERPDEAELVAAAFALPAQPVA